MFKIILINASFQESNLKGFTKFSSPLGLLTIATSLIREGYEVVLIDPQIQQDYLSRIERESLQRPLFVGMTTFMGTNLKNAIMISERIKKIDNHIPVVWGGPLATSVPKICLDTKVVDYVFMGRGEETIVPFARALEKGDDFHGLPVACSGRAIQKISNTARTFNGNLDELPYPQFQLWEEGIKQMGYIPIFSSLGCPRSCAFCINSILVGRKRWYPRSADAVLNEMTYWHEHFKMNVFNFLDDNFLVDTKRACQILEQSAARDFRISHIGGNVADYKPEILSRIAGSRINSVGFSIESASSKIQKMINKPVNLSRVIELFKFFSDNNIKGLATNFMFGFPSETDKDIRANVEMARKIRDLNPTIRMIPYVYTPQPLDDILPQFPLYQKQVLFTVDNLSRVDFAPNRSQYLSPELRPWMTQKDIHFYLNLILVWFYHFDYVVRNSQQIDVEAILLKDSRLAQVFRDVPMPINTNVLSKVT